MGQVLHLRLEWSGDIATEVGNWKPRETPPILLMSEIGIAGACWLQTLDLVKNASPVDFCKTQPTWLRTVLSMEDPTIQI